MVANDAPWGPGVIDVQAVYENPYDLGYSDDDLMMAAEENYLMADMNRRSHPMQEYVPKELAAEMPPDAVASSYVKPPDKHLI